MTNKDKVKIAVAIGLTILIGGAAFFVVGRSSKRTAADEVGVTSFDLPALHLSVASRDETTVVNTSRLVLEDFRGQPLVVNMFASWCTNCDEELPAFVATAERLTGQVNFVFVNSNETGNWESMAKRHGLGAYPIGKDVGGDIVGGTSGNGLYKALGGTQGMPLTAFYRADGTLAKVVRGALTRDSLADKLNEVYGLG